MSFIPSAMGWIIVGGLVAGVCDIVFACVYWAIVHSVPPERILKSVASGLLGKAAYQGGGATALLGLTLHMLLALLMSAAYYAASTHLTPLWQRPLMFGAVYGLLLFGLMNFAVVPLSNAVVRRPGNDPWTWLGIVAHVALIGIPIALATQRAHVRPSLIP